MAGAAKRSRLSELHRMFTEALIEEIKQSKEDEVPLPAADKSVIAKFLKDNDVSADPAEQGKLDDLRQAMINRSKENKANQVSNIVDLATRLKNGTE